jgi:prephenate dehydratase
MPLKIAIQGYEGCFHQIAAQNYFNENVEIVPCYSFSEVVKKTAENNVDAAVMAIENSIAGSILPNYNLLQRSKLYVTGEIFLNIRQHLMMLPGQTLEDIKEVHSHPMALLQCIDFLDRHINWRLVETEDTALSAKSLRTHNTRHVAAIAGDLAAKLFGLDIVAPNIQTEKKNYTRFLVLNRHENKQWEKAPNKASVYFQVRNLPGCLGKVLTCIGEDGINLSKLQSFPVPGGDWLYFFHTDMEFEKLDQLNHALECMKPLTEKLRVLGIYQKGKTV